MDSRDAPPWVAVELTSLGEAKAQVGSLAAQVRRDLGVGEDSLDVFIPVRIHMRGRRSVCITLMPGYIFIEARLDEVAYFGLERYAYCEQVISARGANGMRALCTIPSAEVMRMRKELAGMVASDLQVSQRVRVTGGKYRGLTGTIHHLDLHNAQVGFALRSLHVINSVPRILLEPEDCL